MRVTFDVSAVAPPGGRTIVADVFAPERLPADRPLVCFCLPGGGMSRKYWDLDVPEAFGNYSFARHLTRAGLVVVTVDHLGVGESDRPSDAFSLTPHTVADVNAAAVDLAMAGLRAGTLTPDLPPLPAIRSIGVAHSAGASLTVHQQARHRQHAAIALLGYGGAGLPSHLSEREQSYAHDPERLRRDIVELVKERYDDGLAEMRRGSSDFLVGAPMAPEVREALVACRSPLLTLVGLSSMIPGNATPELEAIGVPVFLGLGDRDIAGSPHVVPAQFPQSRDVTLYVLDDAGHNHNVAPTRERLWDRLAGWIDAVARG